MKVIFLAVLTFAFAASTTSVERPHLGITTGGVQLATATTAVHVPFVGCGSDGQVGPVPAPTKSNQTLPRLTAETRELAFFSLGNIGVLAPLGWHCFGSYGSGGTALLVTPEAEAQSEPLNHGTTIDGPAVLLQLIHGDTSGKFEVAEISARIFPIMHAFVKQVIDEGIEPAIQFPSQPYPNDVLTRLSPTEVEFETPPHKDGLGTRYKLVKNGDPIHGVAFLTSDEYPDLALLDIRLPAEKRQLSSAIIDTLRTTQAQSATEQQQDQQHQR